MLKKYRVWLAAAGIALVLTLIASLFAFRIGDIRVTGVSRLTEGEIISLSQIKDGALYFGVSASKAEKQIKRNPYVENVKIDKIFPGQLNIHVTERKVCGYVLDMGNYIYIDGEGRILDVKEYTEEQLPIITGLKYTSYTKGEILKVEKATAFNTVVFLANLFRAYELEHDIIFVDIKDEGDIKLFIRDLEVRMGSVYDANDKMRYLKEVLPLIPDGENAKGILDLDTGFKGEAARLKLLS